jgi:hypothetical protein
MSQELRPNKHASEWRKLFFFLILLAAFDLRSVWLVGFSSWSDLYGRYGISFLAKIDTVVAFFGAIGILLIGCVLIGAGIGELSHFFRLESGRIEKWWIWWKRRPQDVIDLSEVQSVVLSREGFDLSIGRPSRAVGRMMGIIGPSILFTPKESQAAVDLPQRWCWRLPFGCSQEEAEKFVDLIKEEIRRMK